MDEQRLPKFTGITDEKRLLVLTTESKHGKYNAIKNIRILLDHRVKVLYVPMALSAPLQGEADVYEGRLGESDGEDLEIVLEAVKVSTYLWRVQSSPVRG
jgi:hypothetical protein